MHLSLGSFAANERPLRVLTLYTSALATPLLIACTVISIKVSRRPVTAFCFGYIPVALTAFASTISILCHKKKNTRMPASGCVFLDGFAFVAYLGILIAIWAVGIGEIRHPGLGLLAGYTTAPMIVNM